MPGSYFEVNHACLFCHALEEKALRWSGHIGFVSCIHCLATLAFGGVRQACHSSKTTTLAVHWSARFITYKYLPLDHIGYALAATKFNSF